MNAAPAVPAVRVVAPAWPRRVREALVAYLPVLLMALLALGTWWLVRNTPVPGAERAAVAPRHEPDYTMTAFTVQRFGADGRLRVQIEGDVLHHYPDTDTLEIQGPRIRAFGEDGRVTDASARRAVANGDATEVQLIGDAVVTRGAIAGQDGIEFRGEFLHAFANTERVRSHLPVIVRRGATEVRADGVEYDHLARRIDFLGRSRATFQPRGGVR
jgi:lipopolysaccharide export system protein LptC